MLCDLHIHSGYSSGTQTLDEIADEARAKGIGMISITDDDSLEAYRELPEVASRAGLSWISGVQLSAVHGARIIRLLAYDIDTDDAAFHRILAHNREQMDAFGEAVVACLAQDYPELSVEEYRAHQKVPSYGGFRHSSYMRSKGLPGDYDSGVQLMMPYRDQLVAAYVDQAFATVEETIGMVHSAGGKAVLPGGYLPDPESLRGEIDGLCAMGLDGLEVWSLSYDEEMSQLARTLAEERGLLMTGGGDGHGSWADPNKFVIQGFALERMNLGDIEIVPPS
jgi:predicted metal-dependent phosphoesterase TrpH